MIPDTIPVEQPPDFSQATPAEGLRALADWAEAQAAHLHDLAIAARVPAPDVAAMADELGAKFDALRALLARGANETGGEKR